MTVPLPDSNSSYLTVSAFPAVEKLLPWLEWAYEEVRNHLLVERQEGGARRLAHLHAQVAGWAAEAVQEVLARGQARASELDLIAR